MIGAIAAVKAAIIAATAAVMAASMSAPKAAIAAVISAMAAKNETSPTISAKIDSTKPFIVCTLLNISDKIDCNRVKPNNEKIGYTGV